jgi:hypothetical protein
MSSSKACAGPHYGESQLMRESQNRRPGWCLALVAVADNVRQSPMKNCSQWVWWLGAFLWCVCGHTEVHAQTGFRPIDLAPHYTSTFSEAVSENAPFPKGKQTFDGITFNLGGRIELTGMDAARFGSFAPTKITGIPINQKAARLHLLHGALHGQRDGLPLANIVFHFKNGETRVQRLAFGVHARNSFEEVSSSSGVLADPNSTIAWENIARRTVARMYHTPLDVPLPNQEITSLDYVSLFGRATPLLFALTLQGDAGLTPLAPLPENKIVQRATEFPDSAYRREMSVRVVSAEKGAALSNATAVLTIGDDVRNFFFGSFAPDHAGNFTIAYPPQQAVSMSLRVNARGYATESTNFSAFGTKWPDSLELRLQPGILISGTVVDAAGTPVSNAVVIPYEVTQQSSNEFARLDIDLAKSGPDGKWQASAPTQLLARLNFEVKHPDYHPAQTTISRDELLRGTARIALRPHPQIAGRIVNREGKPVSRASVTLSTEDRRETISADGNGRFKFIVTGVFDTATTLTVFSPDYAPLSQAINPTSAAALELKVDDGSPFSMRLTDARGGPMRDVNVTLYRLQGQLVTLPWSRKTDSEGRFQLDHAPNGPATFRFERSGSSHYYSTTFPSTKELTFAWRSAVRLAGKAIDALTKKPVEQTVRVRGIFSKNGSTSSYSTSGQRGFFTLNLGSTAGDYTNFALTIEAPGYEALSINTPVSDLVSATNVYELKKAKMLEGIVVAPDGSPTANAELVLLEPSHSAYMEEPGKFRRSSSYYDVMISDSQGRFELTPKTNADFVLAAHRTLGFVQVAMADFRKTNQIKLQPWGHVKGVLRVGDKIEPEHYVAVHSDYATDGYSQRGSVPLYLYYKQQPEADGQFEFEAVPPGERTVQLRYMWSERDTGPYRLSHDVRVNVQPNKTNDVIIGGTGRTLVGKLRLTGAVDVKIDGRRGTFRLVSMPGPLPSDIPPPLIIPPSSTPQERLRLTQAHQEKVRERARNRMLTQRSERRTFFVLFDSENNFKVPNVPPGKYTLELSPYDPRAPSTTSRSLGNLNQTLTVPEGTGPFDMGAVEMKVR